MVNLNFLLFNHSYTISFSVIQSFRYLFFYSIIWQNSTNCRGKGSKVHLFGILSKTSGTWFSFGKKQEISDILPFLGISSFDPFPGTIWRLVLEYYCCFSLNKIYFSSFSSFLTAVPAMLKPGAAIAYKMKSLETFCRWKEKIVWSTLIRRNF